MQVSGRNGTLIFPICTEPNWKLCTKNKFNKHNARVLVLAFLVVWYSVVFLICSKWIFSGSRPGGKISRLWGEVLKSSMLFASGLYRFRLSVILQSSYNLDWYHKFTTPSSICSPHRQCYLCKGIRFFNFCCDLFRNSWTMWHRKMPSWSRKWRPQKQKWK